MKKKNAKSKKRESVFPSQINNDNNRRRKFKEINFYLTKKSSFKN